ncbi:MAG: hypothetical protein JWP97_4775 [Labilithrix sp.]|nr:hypothetical protein [Labilithrix sp.]
MSVTQTVRCRALQIRRPWLTSVTLSAGLMLVPLTICALAGAASVWLAPAFLSVALIASATLVGLRERGRLGGALVLVPEGLVVQPVGSERLAVSRGEIRSGYEVPATRAVVLHLEGGRIVTAHLMSDEQVTPEQVLQHLGVDVGQRALTVALRGTVGPLVLGVLSAFTGLAVGGFGIGLAFESLFGPDQARDAVVLATLALTAALVTVVLLAFGWPRAVIGSDGVRLLGRWRRPFVRYEEIAAVRAHDAGVELALTHGRSLQLLTIGQSRIQIDALAGRIAQGRALHEASESRDLASVARDGRPLAVWRADLQRLALAPPGFRDQALSQEDFVRLVLDARAPSDQRIGAALALRHGDPAARALVRVAANASASAELRDALLACAAEGEELDEPAVERGAPARRTLRA